MGLCASTAARQPDAEQSKHVQDSTYKPNTGHKHKQDGANRKRCRAVVTAEPAPRNGVQAVCCTATDAEPSAPGTPSATEEHRGGLSKAARPDATPAAAAAPATSAAQQSAAVDAALLPSSSVDSPAADGEQALQLHHDPGVRAAQQAVLSGRPLDMAQYGACKPPCQAERYATLAAIQASQGGVIIEDPDIKHLLDLACSVLNSDWAMITILEDTTARLAATAGAMAPFCGAEFPWVMSGCTYTLTPRHPEVLVVEDLTHDVRFSQDSFLQVIQSIRGKTERFYCSAPLVAANGHRLGTMCIGGENARKMNAHQLNILTNLAELAVRRLERRWAAEQWASSAGAGLARSLGAYDRPLLLVEVASPAAWDVLYSSPAAAALTGISAAEGERTSLWEKLDTCMPQMERWARCLDSAQRNARFSIVSRRKGSAETSTAPAPPWTLHFRPAAQDAVDKDAMLVGVPQHVQPQGDEKWASRFFIVELEQAPQAAADVMRSPDSVQSLMTAAGASGSALVPAVVPACFEGLELGPLLGKGSYGRVYRGVYCGEDVAVKIMSTDRVELDGNGEPLEAVLSAGKRHSNLVATIAWTVTKPPLPYPGEDAGREAARIAALPTHESQTWLLLEYCDQPCLQDAMDRGLFRQKEPLGFDGDETPVPKFSTGPDMAAICETADQIAQGMSFLHTRNVVHGDLKGGNVLLKSSATTRRGYQVKIADFGTARHLGPQQRVQSDKYGTVTHCPPELLLEGTVSKAVDVWAFGVLLWELYHGTRAWAGLSQPQVMHAIGIAGTRLSFDRVSSPAAYAAFLELAEACMAPNPANRPPFHTMHLVLRALADSERTPSARGST